MRLTFSKNVSFGMVVFCSPQITLGSPQITLGSPQITHGSPQIIHGSPQITHGSPEITQQGAIFEYFGGALEKATFAENPKKCEMENDAEGIKTYFATDFKIIFKNFRRIFCAGRGV